MTTAYAIAWINTSTLKVERVTVCSEGAMTLTIHGSDHRPAELFHVSADTFENAQKLAKAEITNKDSWFFSWAAPLLEY